MFLLFTDCPVDVEDLNKLAQIHDPNKEDTLDYPMFISCKKFISKVCIRNFVLEETIFIKSKV